MAVKPYKSAIGHGHALSASETVQATPVKFPPRHSASPTSQCRSGFGPDARTLLALDDLLHTQHLQQICLQVDSVKTLTNCRKPILTVAGNLQDVIR